MLKLNELRGVNASKNNVVADNPIVKLSSVYLQHYYLFAHFKSTTLCLYFRILKFFLLHHLFL